MQYKLHTAAIALILFSGAIASAEDKRKPDPAVEKTLIEVLQVGKPANKAIACKKLTTHGTKAAVPELAKLLADEQLASWARIALEAIPDPSASEALRGQLGKLNGNLLIGVINSIGVRHDAAAVADLAPMLKHQDAEVAAAAAVALGQIGNPAATKHLLAALANSAPKVRNAVAEGCILCAERAIDEGRREIAGQIYDNVRKAELPKQRILEATRGAIVARKAEGIPLLVEQLESSDKGRFQIALSTARELQGTGINETLAAQLAKTKPERAVLLLSVLADREDAAVTPAVLAAAKSGDKLVRAAAIGVIGRLGNESSLPTLLEIAAGSDAELADSAKLALAALQGDKVDSQIIAQLKKADGQMLATLIEVVGARRISARDELFKAIDHEDASIRRGAILSLGATIAPKDLPLLIEKAIDFNSTDAEQSLVAVKAACVRMPDRDACAEQLAAVMSKSPVATQAKLLEIVAAVGGPKALETIAAAGKSKEELLPDTATKVLGQWLNVDAAPVLLDLAKNEPTGKFRVRALRGYIRLARQFATSEQQRAEMCQNALDTATRREEQKLVFEILQRRAGPESLQVAIKAMDKPDLRDEAAEVAASIAQKLGAKSSDIKGLLAKSASEPVELEIIKAEYGAGNAQKDVTKLLKKHAGKLRWIVLPSPNFNQLFGGDPAPNVVKQLKVKYRMNGKMGEASFDEDSLVVLPMPKD
jgi:HEAT repeat protein